MTHSIFDVAEAADLYTAGSTTVDLASRYNTSPHVVNRALRKVGVVIRPPHRGSESTHGPEECALVLRLYGEGMNQREVAERTRLSRSTVHRMIQNAGVPRRGALRSQTIVVPTDPAILGYIAGLLDGEGNVALDKTRISIYSTTRELMEWLQDTVGGSVRWDHARTAKGWKPCAAWDVSRTRDLEPLLLALRPYLIIKAEKVDQMLAKLRGRTTHHG